MSWQVHLERRQDYCHERPPWQLHPRCQEKSQWRPSREKQSPPAVCERQAENCQERSLRPTLFEKRRTGQRARGQGALPDGSIVTRHHNNTLSIGRKKWRPAPREAERLATPRHTPRARRQLYEQRARSPGKLYEYYDRASETGNFEA